MSPIQPKIGRRECFPNEVLLPPDFDEHAFHLVRDLIVPIFLVACGVTIHFVHANANLLDAQQVNQPRVLPSLSLNLTRLVIAPGDRSREITISWDQDECHIRVGCTGDQVLSEVAIARSINDSVVPLCRVENFGGSFELSST